MTMLRRTSLLLLAGAGLVSTGCSNWTSRETPLWVWNDMKTQDKFKPQARTAFFSDQRTSRRPVEGTVAQGLLKANEPYSTGVAQGNYVAQNPEPLGKAMLERGQERFNIYCAPCHDQTGSGRGIVPLRTNWMPGNLHDDRVVAMVDGELFHVISQGRRSMPAYRYQIPESDRWAIVAYVRALQRSHRSSLSDVPAELRDKLR